MSSVQSLREFISERLTAAAEEIFTEFEKTIVQYEEEIDRQRRLLEIRWKPHVQLQRTEKPQLHVQQQEEVLTAQQLCNQEEPESEPQHPHDDLNSPKEEPEPPKMKEEEEDLCSGQDEEQLLLKQEADTLIPTPKDRDPWEPEPHWDQFFCQNSENQDQEGSRTSEPGPSRYDVDHPELKRHRETHTSEKLFSCEFCGKGFYRSSILKGHMRTHTGERPFSCLTCGKSFTYKHGLNTHMVGHTGVRPYTCVICGKGFTNKNILKNHTRIHTGETPFSCQTCGTSFNQKSNLVRHMRVHTGEKPFPCPTCGKSFNHKCNLIRHMTTHRGPNT